MRNQNLFYKPYLHCDSISYLHIFFIFFFIEVANRDEKPFFYMLDAFYAEFIFILFNFRMNSWINIPCLLSLRFHNTSVSLDVVKNYSLFSRSPFTWYSVHLLVMRVKNYARKWNRFVPFVEFLSRLVLSRCAVEYGLGFIQCDISAHTNSFF